MPSCNVIYHHILARVTNNITRVTDLLRYRQTCCHRLTADKSWCNLLGYYFGGAPSLETGLMHLNLCKFVPFSVVR